MKRRQKQILGWIIAIVILISGGMLISYYNGLPGPHDAFAQCIADSNATFYGAYWCSACNQQKVLFGKSSEYLPYFECSNSDRSQNEACQTANITAYPTWEFADGERLQGAIPLETLAAKTGCEL